MRAVLSRRRDDAVIEENKALVLRYFEEMDRGNIDVVDELIAEDYVDHNPALPGVGPGRAVPGSTCRC